MNRSTRRRVRAGAVGLTAAALALGVYGAESVVNAARPGHPRESAPPAYVLNPDVTQATIRTTICVKGWTATIRPDVGYTDRLKRDQMSARGLAGSSKDYEEDHAVSLELGGNPRDPRNLYPEPIGVARQDDKVENQLHDDVCSGRLTLAQGRARIWALKKEHGL